MNQNKEIVKQAITIGASKFVALSMPFADIVILSKLSKSQNSLADYVFSTQIIQVFIVLCLALSVGIPIFYNQSKEKENSVSLCMGYSFFLGFIIFSLGLILLYLLNFINPLTLTQQLTYIYLSFGILFLPAYIIFSHILDTMGKSNKVFNITIIFAISNLILNLIFVLGSEMHNQVAVALTTTLIRFFGAFLFLYIVFKELSRKYIKPKFDIKNFIQIGSFGISDAATSLLFATSFAALTYYLNINSTDEMVATYGILLNFINIIFVIYIGLSSSISINLSKINGEDKEEIKTSNDKYWNKFIIKFCLLVGFIIFILIPIFSWLYFGHIKSTTITIMSIALLVALFDGMNISIISKLRVLGFKKHPPLFRMSLVFIGMPIGVLLLKYFDISGVFIAFAFANFLALVMLLAYDKYKIPKN